MAASIVGMAIPSREKGFMVELAGDLHEEADPPQANCRSCAQKRKLSYGSR
jgi:hypothetical protein